MNLACGTDIIEISRVKDSISNDLGDKFLESPTAIPKNKPIIAIITNAKIIVTFLLSFKFIIKACMIYLIT